MFKIKINVRLEYLKWLCSRYKPLPGVAGRLCSRYKPLPRVAGRLCSRYKPLPGVAGRLCSRYKPLLGVAGRLCNRYKPSFPPTSGGGRSLFWWSDMFFIASPFWFLTLVWTQSYEKINKHVQTPSDFIIFLHKIRRPDTKSYKVFRIIIHAVRFFVNLHVISRLLSKK